MTAAKVSATRKPAPAKPLPCPFCGEKPRVWKYPSSWDCYCRDLSCGVRPAATRYHTKALAIAAWNRRAK